MKDTFTGGSLIVEMKMDEVLMVKRFSGRPGLPKQIELEVGSFGMDDTEVVIDTGVICEDRNRKGEVCLRTSS